MFHTVYSHVLYHPSVDVSYVLYQASLCFWEVEPGSEAIYGHMAMSGSAAVYHCVFGNLEESLQKCIWSALDDSCSTEPPTIAFWLDGFTAINGEWTPPTHGMLTP